MQVNQAECRICTDYATDHEALLHNACNCKGSVASVHESCLIKWLKMKGIRKCEVCHANYNFQEEYGTFFEVLKKTRNYLLADKQRIVQYIVYGFGIYLLQRRIRIQVQTIYGFFRRIGKSIMRVLFRAKSRTSQRPLMIYRLVQSIWALFKSIFKVAYNVFMSYNLALIAVQETKRIKKMINALLSEIKELRIRERDEQIQKQDVDNQPIDLIVNHLQRIDQPPLIRPVNQNQNQQVVVAMREESDDGSNYEFIVSQNDSSSEQNVMQFQDFDSFYESDDMIGQDMLEMQIQNNIRRF